jgi:serine/threonine protein kinase
MAKPRKLGKYEIRGELGRGAMGVVYEAYDPIIERRIAIKTVRTDAFDQDGLKEVLPRFEREAKASGKLSHPNIVTTYDFGQDDGTAYMVMEFVAGKPLSELLGEHASFPLDDSVRIVTQILAALEHAHRNGVVHRDIKPANVLVLPDGGIKVTDFGIARLESSTMTQAGHRLGSPQSMSPEQVLGKDVDRRSDIFSTGIILYELLTGEKPFHGESLTAVMHQVLKVDPPPPSELDHTLPHAVDDVIRKALAKRPAERFQTAEAFALALRQAAQTPSGASSTPFVATTVPLYRQDAGMESEDATTLLAPDSGRGRKTRLWPWAAAILLLAVPAVAFLLWDNFSDAPPPTITQPAPAPPMAPKPPTPKPAPVVSGEALELAFWNSIKDSKDSADFKEYLRKYPEGQFAGLARNRLAQLTPPEPKPLPPEGKKPAIQAAEQDPLDEEFAGSGETPRTPAEIARRQALARREAALGRRGSLYQDGADESPRAAEARRRIQRAIELRNQPRRFENPDEATDAQGFRRLPR